MAGVTNKFSAGDAVTAAPVNANFTDLQGLTTAIQPSSVLVGNLFGSHISIASPPREFASMESGLGLSVSNVGKCYLVGSNGIMLGPAGPPTNVPFSDIGNDDIVIVSATAWFTWTNPPPSVADEPEIGVLTLEAGIPGTEAVLVSGADGAARTFSGLHQGGPAVAPLGYGSELKWEVSLDWMFQATFPAVPDPRNITLFVNGMSQFTTCRAAAIHVYVVKR